MKKILLVVVMYLYVSEAYAQLIKGQAFSGSTVGVMFNKTIQRNSGLPIQSLNVSIVPEFGFVISKNFTTSMRFSFDYYQYKEIRRTVSGGRNFDEDLRLNQFAFGPGITFRYYKIFKSNFGFFVQWAFDGQALKNRVNLIAANGSETSVDLRGYRLAFAFTPGIVYFPRPLVCIYASYGSFGYTYSTTWEKGSPNISEKNHSLVFNYLPSSLRLGVDFYLPLKKKNIPST